jgi:PAS domain-containing protein
MDGKSAVSVRDDDQGLASLKPPSVLLQDIVQGRDRDHAVNGLIANLARPDYSITNLIHDVAELKESIAKTEATTDRLLNRWNTLDRLVGDCVAVTTLSHEKFIESTSHAFCNYDQYGIILSANQRMLDLNPNCISRPLEGYFEDIRTELKLAIAKGSQRPLDLLLRTRRGVSPMLAEFGRIQTDAGQGGYALLLDMSDRIQAERKALEAAPFGMLKLDARHRIVFATEKACELLKTRPDDLVGIDARRLLSSLDDRESRLKVVRAYLERRKGSGGEYDVVLKRPKSDKPTQLTHIRVSGLPLFDDAGRFAGSIERLQPTDRTVAREALAKLVATESDYQALYAKIVVVLKTFIEFDWANLFIYSPERDYTRLVCTYGPDVKFESRWFATPDGYEDWLKSDDTWMEDLSTYDPALLKTADTQISVVAGMRALVCIPVRRGGKLIGGLCLISRHRGLYNTATRRSLEDLMIEQALLSLIDMVDQAERNFLSSLVKEISGIEDLKLLAKSVVDGLARFYQFQNVSIFKVNVLSGYFSLLAQAIGLKTAVPMQDDYQQPIKEGLLGRCFASGDYVILSDNKDPESAEARIYVRATGKAGAPQSQTRSELCVPIRLFNRVLWILNLEDDRKDAFTPLEVATLKRVIDQIQSVLERTFQSTILAQVLDVCPAGIVITKQDHMILRCNREALEMLQLDTVPQDENLSGYLHAALSVLSSEPTSSTLIGARKGEVPVQVSRFTLEEEYDHVVFLIQDVAELKWSRNFAKVKAALAETTAQTRIPVSLLASYLRRLSQPVDRETLQDLASKAMHQMDRIELTYDRVLAAYGKDALPHARTGTVDVGQLINYILSELPKLEREEIRAPEKMDFGVSADSYRILFALSSMLSYLLRSRANAEPIIITVSAVGAMVEIAMMGAVRQNTGAGDLAALINATRAEIGLARSTLVQIARDCGGEFKSRCGKGRQCLVLQLPATAVTR